VVVALYAAGLVLSSGLLAYVPFRLAVWLGGAEGQPAAWQKALLVFLAAASVLYWGRSCFLYALAFRHRDRGGWGGPPPELDRWPFVSIWIPAYNEAECIESALESLLELDYPHFEVLVVDDGSSDDTYQRARRFEGRHPRCTLRVFRKPNGGKWTAHNLAFHHSRGELVLCLDADSRVEPGALRWMVARMADPAVDAVAGNVRVRNVVNFVTRCQALEYLVSNDLLRVPMNPGGTVLIVPGPLGLFRRSALEEVYLRWGALDRPLGPGEYDGPFEGDTFAEDFDLSLAVLALGGRVVYEPRAVSRTRVPATAAALISQRYRWTRGNFQAIRKYFRRAWRDPSLRRGRLMAWLAATYLPDLALWLAVDAACLVLVFLTLAGLAAGNWLLLAQWLACALLNLNNVALFLLKYREPNKLALLLAVPFMEVYHGLLVAGSFAISAVDELRGARMQW
jgi:cellulose synthase/poly-beta-1,6-N-acetylglucosamine synthase-like glycosyltransferase